MQYGRFGEYARRAVTFRLPGHMNRCLLALLLTIGLFVGEICVHVYVSDAYRGLLVDVLNTCKRRCQTVFHRI